jgi:hypothetical protein
MGTDARATIRSMQQAHERAKLDTAGRLDLRLTASGLPGLGASMDRSTASPAESHGA